MACRRCYHVVDQEADSRGFVYNCGGLVRAQSASKIRHVVHKGGPPMWPEDSVAIYIDNINKQLLLFDHHGMFH